MTSLAAVLHAFLLAAPTGPSGDEIAVPLSAAVCAVQYRADLLIAEASEAGAAGPTEKSRGLRAAARAGEAVAMYGMFLTRLASLKLNPFSCTHHQVMRVARCLNVEFTTADEGRIVWARTRPGCEASNLGSFTRVVEVIEAERLPKLRPDETHGSSSGFKL